MDNSDPPSDPAANLACDGPEVTAAGTITAAAEIRGRAIEPAGGEVRVISGGWTDVSWAGEDLAVCLRPYPVVRQWLPPRLHEADQPGVLLTEAAVLASLQRTTQQWVDCLCRDFAAKPDETGFGELAGDPPPAAAIEPAAKPALPLTALRGSDGIWRG
jgi:hypothetical protein